MRIVKFGCLTTIVCVALLFIALVMFENSREVPPDGVTKATPTSAPSAPIANPQIATQAPTKTAQPAAARFKAEDIVTFPESAIACLTKDGLKEVLALGARGENTKMKAMFINSGAEGAECMMLNPDLKVKIISVEYNSPNNPEFGLLEIVGANVNASKTGAWTLAITAKKAK